MIRVGDWVLSRDQFDAGDDVERQQVTAVFERTTDHLQIVTILDADGNIETIRTTDEHPFYVAGVGWLRAGDLTAGMTLSEADATNDAVVLRNIRELHPEGITVYNFEVAGDHTYFVEDGVGEQTLIWVHNTCRIKPHGVYPYGIFNARINVRDGLSGHEILQSAWLRKRGISTALNPALALTKLEHGLVTRAQGLAGLLGKDVAASMSRTKLIRHNMRILKGLQDALGLSDDILMNLHREAVMFARTLK